MYLKESLILWLSQAQTHYWFIFLFFGEIHIYILCVLFKGTGNSICILITLSVTRIITSFLLSGERSAWHIFIKEDTSINCIQQIFFNMTPYCTAIFYRQTFIGLHVFLEFPHQSIIIDPLGSLSKKRHLSVESIYTVCCLVQCFSSFLVFRNNQNIFASSK